MSQVISDDLLSCGKGLKIYLPCHITGRKSIEIKNNVHINKYSVIQGSGGLEIGNNVHIGPRLTLYTSSHNYRGKALPYDNTVIKKKVVIEDNVWIGACVTILPGVTIGEGAIIAAGTVLVKDVPPLKIIGEEHIIKEISKRDTQLYQRLKASKSFGGVGGKLIK